MSRLPRRFPAGTIVHAYNRGVERRTIFEESGDYAAFVDLLREARSKQRVRIFGYCVLPNHWHLVLQAEVDSGISEFMHWLTSTHVKRHRRFHGMTGGGHLYQDRYKCPLIEGEQHFFTALRYTEANAAVAGLARNAEDWIWGSAYERQTQSRGILSDTPYVLPTNWNQRLADYVAACRIRDGGTVPGTVATRRCLAP